LLSGRHGVRTPLPRANTRSVGSRCRGTHGVAALLCAGENPLRRLHEETGETVEILAGVATATATAIEETEEIEETEGREETEETEANAAGLTAVAAWKVATSTSRVKMWSLKWRAQMTSTATGLSARSPKAMGSR